MFKDGKPVDRRQRDADAEPPEALPGDWRTDPPWRRTPPELQRLLRRRWWMRQVLLPHLLAFLIGGALFVLAAAGWSGFADLGL
ncbi:hypothetical protein GON03_05850 [Nocardioides sp. MAH-18]|uniref:Uncharacterized protein n=1 Tax=Nocardioides agri TaxID=2682843 RepID=A0A6L6XP27_9ACTN|nr:MULTISPECIES: hypothetical protein [unclassified Nocardioides]MBA2953833.1 hypothetical protein [Nocardioides sp. CGMCC 1.13656]MVQ48698.1 hypothetical protein [Nocardioides sp. MAH-18]